MLSTRQRLLAVPLLLAVALALDLALLLMLLEAESAAFYQENSLLELLQQGVLASTIAAGAWRLRGEHAQMERRALQALCLLALAVFYRESDLQALLAPEAPLRAALLALRKLLGPLLWLGAALALWRCPASGGRALRRLRRSVAARLLGGTILLMVLAALLDKSLLATGGPNRFFEELLELDAYLLLLATAFAPLQRLAPRLGGRVPGTRGACLVTPAAADRCRSRARRGSRSPPAHAVGASPR